MTVHSAPCGNCYWCRKNQGNLCESVMETKVLGAFADYVKVPAHIVARNMFLKPEHLSFEEAAFLEPLACVVYGLSNIRVDPEDTVLIIGPGAIGLLFYLTLKAKGVQNVIISGQRPYRLSMARYLGAEVTSGEPADILAKVKDLTSGRGADLVIECTGQLGVWQQAIDYCRRGGDLILFGDPPKGSLVSFDTHRLHYDQITVHSPFHFNPAAVRDAYQLLADRLIDVQPLITDRFPLTELAYVFNLLQQGDCVKYAIIP